MLEPSQSSVSKNTETNGTAFKQTNGSVSASSPYTLHPTPHTPLAYTDAFVDRHIGPRDSDIDQMLAAIGFDSLEALMDAAIPRAIRLRKPLRLESGKAEYELLAELKEMAQENHVFRSFIGMGYANCITPPVIQRNILENPGWYTQYTPYQPEIAQGRLEPAELPDDGD